MVDVDVVVVVEDGVFEKVIESTQVTEHLMLKVVTDKVGEIVQEVRVQEG